MKPDFSKYHFRFAEEDIMLIKNPKVFKQVVFQQNGNRIAIIVDPPGFKNQFAVYFSTNKNVDKFIFSLFDKDYHRLLIQILLKFNFGDSKFIQLDLFNKIQRSIISYYIDEKGCKYLYRETTKNSPFYAFTIQPEPLEFNKMFNICEIDEDRFLESFQNRISNLVSKDIISAANINFVYLQHNKKNNLYKIGFSKTTKHREKTLQSEEPDIQLYRQWMTSQKYEGLLKKKFKGKRKRGEWFELDQEDLKIIDKMMCKFYNSISLAIIGLTTQIVDSLVKK